MIKNNSMSEPVEQPTIDSKIIYLKIVESKWLSFDEQKPPIETPVWLKLPNGSIVLAQYGNNGSGSTGWWKVGTDGKKWFVNCNEAYLTRNASWQPCDLFPIS